MSREQYLVCTADVGLLTNQRIALEIAAGIAHLTKRSLKVRKRRLGGAPESIAGTADTDLTIFDVLEVPPWISEVETDWEPHDGAAAQLDWTDLALAVFSDGSLDPALLDSFAMGRDVLTGLGDLGSERVVEFTGRSLAFPSIFFAVGGTTKFTLDDALRQIRPREEFSRYADDVAGWLGRYNASHLRRTDLLKGLQAYRQVTGDEVALNLRTVFERDDLLVVCSDAKGDDPFFDPLRREFREIVFLNELVLGIGRWRERFDALPVHEENALGLITQEVAARAAGFVGTIGSTFTGAIHRERVRRDPDSPFWFSADYTPPGPLFENCEYVEITEGPYSWNRLAYGMDAATLAWFRAWPEDA
ncbi:MAG: O-fucosyltransferase family protein [Acidimicrobiales bacterium]